MQFYQLIKTNNWLSVQLTLLQLYPNELEGIETYKEVFTELQQMQPITSDMQLEIRKVIENYKGEINTYHDVCGFKSDDNISYAIEFTPWAEWLGMVISPLTLQNFNELEIISYCLYEMTFCGYEEETKQEYMGNVIKNKDEYEKMTNQEKKKNTYTLEELRKLLHDKDDDMIV